MDEKENGIDLEKMDVSLENPTLDLKAIRESRGLILKDMSSSTKVSLSNLKAIEEQKFELLPDPIYAKAFIGAYARSLDIDGEELLSLYDKYLESLEPDKNQNEILKRLAGKKRHEKYWIWLTIASCVIVITGFFYLNHWSFDDSREMRELAPVGEIESTEKLQDFSGDVPALEKDDKILETVDPDLSGSTDISDVDDIKDTGQVIEKDRQPEIEGERPTEETTPDETVVGEEDVPDEAVASGKAPYTLVIEASELTWIQINRDGKPPFEVMLRPGERITEKASEKFGLIIGNAAGVDISFQGKPLGIIGKHGEVVHLILPADM
ncbi:MAG: helix-turn-helix domain-containing protein [Deltaproteobacteria bacterium]|nr:helix-turn-helix domain-containing protein [Deltaproteobacteria bacterium]